MVWNETSGTLVTKSDVEGIWRLYHFLRMDDIPKQCLIRLEVFEMPADGSMKQDAKPAYFLAWMTKSGIKSSAASEAQGKRIDAEAELTFRDHGEVMDLTLEGTFRLPGHARMQMRTDIALKSGTALWVGGDRDDKRGVEVRVTVSTVLLDGAPLKDLIRVQKDGVVVPISHPRKEFEKHRIEGKAWLCLAPVMIEAFIDANENDPLNGPDSELAARREALVAAKLAKLKTIEVPKQIGGWFGGPVLDIREILRGFGIRVTEGKDFAGYDVAGKAVVFLTGSDTEADKLEALFMTLDGSPPRMVAVSCEDRGKIHMMTRAGRTAYLIRGEDDKNEIRRMEVCPTFSEDAGFVDLKIYFGDHPSPESAVVLNTSVILENGRPLEVHDDGVKTPLKIEAVILEP